MLFRDPVDGVGGRPHLGVPPRAAVPGKAGVSIGKKKKSVDHECNPPLYLTPIVPSLIGTEKISRAPFQTPFPHDDGSRSFRDMFKIVKSVDHESNTGSYVLCNSGVADIF